MKYHRTYHYRTGRCSWRRISLQHAAVMSDHISIPEPPSRLPQRGRPPLRPRWDAHHRRHPSATRRRSHFVSRRKSLTVVRLTRDVTSVAVNQPVTALRRLAGGALPRQYVHRRSATVRLTVAIAMIQVARAVGRALADSPAVSEELTLTLTLLEAISINLMVLF